MHPHLITKLFFINKIKFDTCLYKQTQLNIDYTWSIQDDVDMSGCLSVVEHELSPTLGLVKKTVDDLHMWQLWYIASLYLKLTKKSTRQRC